MKKRYKMLLTFVAVLVIAAVLFLVLTPPINYDVEPDTASMNRDKTNNKQRPFIVDKQEYPFESNWFERNGTSMHYIDEGEGIPVILCHGNPDWSFLYRNIIKELDDECRLIAYDLPGFGFSDTPKNYGFTPQEHAEWINALVVDHLKLDKFIIVVQDWGGPTGLWVATHNSEKVLGAVISNTWAWEAEGSVKWFSYAMRTSMAKRLIMNRNFFVTDLLIDGLKDDLKNNKAVTDAYLLALPTVESRFGAAEFPAQITKVSSWLNKLEGDLHTLNDKPIEFIFGQKDFALGGPDIVEKWHSIYPEAPIKLLPEAGHFTQEDSPESFVTSIRRIIEGLEPKVPNN